MINFQLTSSHTSAWHTGCSSSWELLDPVRGAAGNQLVCASMQGVKRAADEEAAAAQPQEPLFDRQLPQSAHPDRLETSPWFMLRWTTQPCDSRSIYPWATEQITRHLPRHQAPCAADTNGVLPYVMQRRHSSSGN